MSCENCKSDNVVFEAGCEVCKECGISSCPVG